MALIAIAIYDTHENKRTQVTKRMIDATLTKIDFSRHSVWFVDNNSCDETKRTLEELVPRCHVLTLPANIGTARAINKAWANRMPGEHCVKMDNDCIVNDPWRGNWVDEMEDYINRDPSIGIVGLKRKDLLESPTNETEWWRSTLRLLPHRPGERWMVIEECMHVIGTCQMYGSKLLDKIGYLYQMGGLYGFDDGLAAVRAHVSGFSCGFIPYIPIDHIDPQDEVGTSMLYQKWKEKYSGTFMTRYHEVANEYVDKKRSVWQGPEDE